MSKLNRQLFYFKKGYLENNERILSVVLFSYSEKKGSLTSYSSIGLRNAISIATNEKVIVFKQNILFGHTISHIKYDKISTVDIFKSILGYTIIIYGPGSQIKLKWEKDGDIDNFLNRIKLYNSTK